MTKNIKMNKTDVEYDTEMYQINIPIISVT